MTRQSARADGTMEAIAQRYRPALLAYFSRRVVDRDEIEDLTQEVFAKLARRSELHTIDNIEGYIFRIAVNLIRSRARTAMRRPDILHDGSRSADQLVDEISPELAAIGAEAWQIFVQALQELPERSRTIFVLNRLEEMTAREIAVHLGISMALSKQMHFSVRGCL